NRDVGDPPRHRRRWRSVTRPDPIAAAVAAIIAALPTTPPRDLLSIPEAIDELRISRSQFYRIRAQGRGDPVVHSVGQRGIARIGRYGQLAELLLHLMDGVARVDPEKVIAERGEDAGPSIVGVNRRPSAGVGVTAHAASLNGDTGTPRGISPMHVPVHAHLNRQQRGDQRLGREAMQDQRTVLRRWSFQLPRCR
ncbi:hypothetical protein ABQF39_30615, partial [Mycobacterium syngnathidarum]